MKTNLAQLSPADTPKALRTIGRLIGDPEGPTLIAVGGIHGNEPSGQLALERVRDRLEPIQARLRGRVFLLSGNVRALMRGVRFQDFDLNRGWTRANILRNSPGLNSPSPEDLEQHELLTIFRDILQSASDEVYALDLHSTSAGGRPFATVGDTLRNRNFARRLPITLLLGIEEQLEGTLLEFLNNEGAVTLGFEAGQHLDPAAVDNHEALVLLALVHAGILSAADLPDTSTIKGRLQDATGTADIFEVRHREAVSEFDGFRMQPGLRNFDPVRRGQVVANNHDGAIRAPENGQIMMPLYQKQGEDGFFIVRQVASFWLRLSALLRQVKAAEFVHFLPGVRPYPKHPEQLQIDTRIARYFPLQFFHLLGFRKLKMKKNFLLVSRRRYDTSGPFTKRRQ